MADEIKGIVDDAVEWADKSPYPDPEDCLKNVYFEG
jgi:TPP-dependent pyruvate/acetoin dehydrogenase alpha subunit